MYTTSFSLFMVGFGPASHSTSHIEQEENLKWCQCKIADVLIREVDSAVLMSFILCGGTNLSDIVLMFDIFILIHRWSILSFLGSFWG